MKSSDALPVDTVVIGGGVAGSCVAYWLVKEGIDTLVVERDEVNLQASGANAGSLHVQLLAFDFTGSAPQHDGNLNCPLAVTHSACYFAVLVLTDPSTPANAGAYRPLDIRVPEGSLLNARRPAAVAAGNVETSSRVADVVLRAFGYALGQGTMNNLTLGDDDVVYYETIGGGQGACRDADGPSGVHVAMSNTLNTPIEALELEFPLRMVRYELRRGSGGRAGADRRRGPPATQPTGRRRSCARRTTAADKTEPGDHDQGRQKCHFVPITLQTAGS